MRSISQIDAIELLQPYLTLTISLRCSEREALGCMQSDEVVMGPS